MEDLTHLFGTCACERNQYTIVIPASSASLAQVILDNSSAANAYLRIPLDWHHSTTFALFPDETHASIKRTFYSPASSPPSPHSTAPAHPADPAGPTDLADSALQPPPPPTRRQFCGYCGTQLTAWNETSHGHGAFSGAGGGYIDVALGSLVGESLARLESLRLEGMDEDEDEEEEDGDVMEGQGGARGEGDTPVTASTAEGRSGTQTPGQRAAQPSSRTGGGVSYFESSWLGRIKRRKGRHTSADGTRSVEWEVVELEGEDEGERAGAGVEGGNGGKKRMRVDA